MKVDSVENVSISGLVVEYNVAIVVTRVRFPADALFYAGKTRAQILAEGQNVPYGARTRDFRHIRPTL